MSSRLLRLPVFAVSLCVACASQAEPIAPVAQPTQPATTRNTEKPAFDPARHMHTSEVKPGMTGYGLSVFRGTAIEKFNVEVISVMRNQVGPGHDIVLIRCSGQGLEHSGAIEGMSGSPIYLLDATGKHRLIGAFALGWENSKDPIIGVRPIEEMLSVPTTSDVDDGKSAMKIEAGTWNAIPMIARRGMVAHSSTHAGPSQLKRLALPLTVAGLSDTAFAGIAPMLQHDGLTPLQGGATAGADADPNAKLEPGAAVGIPIVTGDLDVSALGTVTEVLGNRIYVFGHEFNAEGAVDLPMGVGYVHTVIPATTISFKMGSILRLDGAIHNDESTAVAGTIGDVPKMIPVTVAVKTPQRKGEHIFHFQVTRHPKFTPMGAVTSMMSAISSNSALPNDFTVKYTIKMTFDNGQVLNLSDAATSTTRAKQLARDMNLPLTLALQNPFGKAYPTSISARFEVLAEAKLDELKSVATDKDIYKPGETVAVYVTTLNQKGQEATRQATLDLPDDLPEGDYTLTAGDADRALADETRDAPYRYQVRNLDEIFGLIREVTQRPSQQLYLRLASHGQGVSIGRTPLQGLPASRVRVMARPGLADVLPYVPSIVQPVAWDVPLEGSTDIELKVSRTPDKVARPISQVPGGTMPPAQPPSTPATPPPAAADGGD